LLKKVEISLIQKGDKPRRPSQIFEWIKDLGRIDMDLLGLRELRDKGQKFSRVAVKNGKRKQANVFLISNPPYRSKYLDQLLGTGTCLLGWTLKNKNV